MIKGIRHSLDHGTCKNTDEGQVLPGFIFLLVLCSFLAFGLIKNLNQYAKSLYENERRVLKESEHLLHSHIALNGLVLNNIKLLEQFIPLLKSLDSALTQSMSIAATTLLWEKALPIPHPHDVFRRLNSNSTDASKFVQLITESNKEIIKFVSAESAVQLNFLTVGQSLCQIPCVHNIQTRISGYDCKSGFAISDSCTVTALQVPAIPPPLRSLPLKSLFTEELWNSTGFIFIDKNRNFRIEDFKSSSLSLEVVHPALCETDLISFAIPCLNRRLSELRLFTAEHRLSFLPHWSIAIDKSAL